MAKTKISEFSSTAASNTDIDNINIAEGCSPANVNNAIRGLMAQLKDFQSANPTYYTADSDALAVGAGGTGAITATTARTNLSAAKSGANSDITSITGLTTALSTLQGGTGAIQKAISNVARTSNVVTITTSTAHGFAAGHYVTIAAVTNTSLNGTFLIATVATNTFTYAQTAGDISSVADTGTALDITYCNLANNVTGTLPSAKLDTVLVANGGTGATTLTSGSVIVGAGTSTPTFVAPTTTGNCLFTTDGTTWSSTPKITSATAQNTTSGTSITFSSIPAWVKRITVMFNGVSTSGASIVQVQIGSGSVTTTGYLSTAWQGGAGDTGNRITTGFGIDASGSSAHARIGQLVITNISGNIWIGAGTVARRPGTDDGVSALGGNVTLAGVLDRVVLTTVSGTDTFDAGSVNIMYE